MAHFKNIQQESHVGKINYGDKILDGIVYLAVNELEDVTLAVPKVDSKNTKDIIKIKVNKKNVDITVNVRVFFTQSISETAFKIQEAVRHNVETMTEYKVHSVNVNVCGVIFTKDNTKKDKNTELKTKTDVIEKKESTKIEEKKKNKATNTTQNEKNSTSKKVTNKSKDKEAR